MADAVFTGKFSLSLAFLLIVKNSSTQNTFIIVDYNLMQK